MLSVSLVPSVSLIWKFHVLKINIFPFAIQTLLLHCLKLFRDDLLREWGTGSVQDSNLECRIIYFSGLLHLTCTTRHQHAIWQRWFGALLKFPCIPFINSGLSHLTDPQYRSSCPPSSLLFYYLEEAELTNRKLRKNEEVTRDNIINVIKKNINFMIWL